MDGQIKILPDPCLEYPHLDGIGPRVFTRMSQNATTFPSPPPSLLGVALTHLVLALAIYSRWPA